MNDDAPRRYSFFPKALSDCVERVTRPVMKGQGLAGSRVLTDWHSIVGPELARHCIPERLSFPRGKKTGGTLTVAAENGFATELTHLQPLILERLASYFGYQAVTRLSISHSFLPPPEKPPAAPPPRRARLPAQCSTLADEVEDEALKAALKSLAEALSGTPT